jgi:cytochrome c peroxidase
MKHLRFLASTLPCLVACSPPATHAGEGPPLGKPGTFPLAEIQHMVKQPVLHVAFVPEAPLGITRSLAEVIPSDNPLTRAKVELGGQLFFDPRLSHDRTIACASCHHPSLGWADAKAVSTGIHGQRGARSAPTIANRALGATQFWDGRARSLEESALAHLGNLTEMGFTPQGAAERLNGIEGYRIQFEAVFGGPATPERIARALSAFERTILSGNGKLDVYERARPFLGYEAAQGDEPELLLRMKTALEAEAKRRLSEPALRGRELFLGKARCGTCHAGQDLTDELFHNVGIGMDRRNPDLGRYVVTQVEKDKGAFKTPTLRNVARTAPYMHDGSLATLRAVVDHYDKGGIKNAWLSERIEKLGLSEGEKQDLVAFLEEGLSGETTPVSIPRLP